jgi:GNAT superfamily N-acetyltransferase
VTAKSLVIEPVDAARWDDLVALFGPNGAYSNCWCTWWRLSAKEWDAAGASARREHLHEVVRCGTPPGLLAYLEGAPVGWVAVAPRGEYPRLNRSPHTRPVDDVPVWSVTCFWIPRAHRGTGVATALLDSACGTAADAGVPAIEGYPVDPAVRRVGASDAYTGTVPMFQRAGFVEIARRSPTGRVVMRRDLTS